MNEKDRKSCSVTRNLYNEPYNRNIFEKDKKSCSVMNPIIKKMNEKDRNSCSVSRNLYNEPYNRNNYQKTENHAQYREICVVNPIRETFMRRIENHAQ